MPAIIQQADEAILLFIQMHVRCGFLNAIMKTASFLGNAGMLWIAAAVVLLALRKTRRAGLDVALSLALSALFNNLIIKNLVCRPRPFLEVEGLKLLISPLYSYSFPSGHACSSFAAATALALCFRGRGGAWAYVPAALIAVSRAYVGIHYPSDVLCGAAFGTLCAWLVYRISRRYIGEDFHLRSK